MYKCNHFRIEELVPQDTFEEFRDDQNSLWWIFDQRVLYVIDRLRDDYGVMNCNDWLWGGKYNYRGFRPMEYKYGANLSQHRFGRAMDLVPKSVHPDDIRKDILNYEREYMRDIRGLEMDISWLHVDVRNQKGKILKFYPRK